MESIKQICKKLGIKKYTINPDLSVDVDSSVNISNKDLTEIPIVFNKVSAYFDCSGNKLTTLEGCPRYVGKWFNCSSNQLTSLDYSPNYVGGNFICDEKAVGISFKKNIIPDYNNYIILYRRKLVLEQLFKQ